MGRINRPLIKPIKIRFLELFFLANYFSSRNYFVTPRGGPFSRARGLSWLEETLPGRGGLGFSILYSCSSRELFEVVYSLGEAGPC